MLLLPWDALFLAGFAYSGYRTVGRWFKYTDDTAKAQSGTIRGCIFCQRMQQTRMSWGK